MSILVKFKPEEPQNEQFYSNSGLRGLKTNILNQVPNMETDDTGKPHWGIFSPGVGGWDCAATEDSSPKNLECDLAVSSVSTLHT